MKKFIVIIFSLFYTLNLFSQACCPEFSLVFKKDVDCARSQICMSAIGGGEFTASMCKYSTNTFLVTPNLPGYTYSWTVTGGTYTPVGGNPVSITWGGGSSGTVSVTITSADGSCVKTLTEKICLRDAPQASFTFGPNNVCPGVPIIFNNTSVGGASVAWNFGDGNTAGNVNSVTHTYAASGTYTVTLTVSTDTAICVSDGTGGQPPQKPCCGCVTTYTQQVTIINGTPLTIVPKNCVNQCLCVGDKQEYCASTTCGTYNWTVSGGNIVSGAGTQCITVQWTGPYPTSITLNTPGCGNSCGNSATLNVPVVVPNIPISPLGGTVCQGSTQTYSLPAMPGVFYNWNVIGGTITGPSINTNTISVVWSNLGPGQVSCTYSNPLKKNCSGSSMINVTVKPVMKITGPSQSCVGCTASFSVAPGTANWTVSPAATLTPTSGSTTSITFTAANTYTLTATNAAFCNSPQTHTIVVAPKPVITVVPASAIACPGTPVKFVATSTVTNTPIVWSLPAGATMVANTGPQQDTAVIQFATLPATVNLGQRCTYGLGCSIGTASVTITKPPIPLLAPGNTTPCIDATYTYSITNYVPGNTYTWSITSGLGTITSGQGTGSVQILWHGNLSVANAGTIMVTNCSGSANLNVTVSLPPVVTITQTGTCLATGITLTSSGPGPWSWSTGQTTQSITITQPGSYTVTVGASGCQGVKTIVIPPSPYYVAIIPPCIVSSCNLNTLTVPFTVSTNSPGTSCQWWFIPAGGGPAVPAPGGNICGNYTGTQLGTYFYVITLPNGCKDTSNRIRVPEDINICCASSACSTIPANAINFTHTGCSPTNFTGSFTLPPGWQTGTLPVSYCFGDGTGQTSPSLNATHQYAAAGLYNACIVRKIYKPSGTPGINDTCCVSNCHDVVIPVVTKFTFVYNCNTGILSMNSSASTFYPSSAGAVYTWSYSGAYSGTLTGAASQAITPTASGTYTITLSITLAGCTSTYSLPVTVVLPNATITATPNPTCVGSPVSFSTTPGLINHNWQFGDNNFSLAAAPQHAYNIPPTTYTVTLTAQTPQGCNVSATTTVNVQPKPIVTVTPNPVTVCPGTPVTLTASITPNGNTMCPNLTNYNFQWYLDNNPVGPPTGTSTYLATSYGVYHAVLTGIGSCNCVITTNKATVNWYPKPVADIKGRSTVCLDAITGIGTVNLTNSVNSYPGYSWSANSANVTFDATNIWNPVVTVTGAGNYQVYLEVTDANGCKAKDTLCLYAAKKPAVSITPPAGTLCSGNVYSLLANVTPATAPPLGYNYLWNTSASTNPIQVSAPGVYFVAVTDMNTGCSGVSNNVFINPMPDLSLFPSCCDTLCDTTTKVIIPPLPLMVGQNACAVYNIVWLNNNVPISPQPSPCNALPIASLGLGQHNISIAVTLNGCTDTSKVFSLFIKKCNCDCKGSHWGDITLTPGEAPPPKPNVKANIPGQIKLACNQGITVECNKPYTLNASYICADTACASKVTYSLQPPTGPAITGTMPPAFTFTPNQTGVYILTLYGWCDGKKCDSCTIDITVKCDPNCCEGSKWKDNPWYYFEDPVAPKPVKLDCAIEPVIYINGKDCKKPLIVGSTISCPPNCTGTDSVFVYDNANTVVLSGPSPLTISGLPNGTYTIVFNGYCGGKLCLTCKAKLKIDCPPEEPCDCKGSKWGERFVTINNNSKPFNCNKEFTVKCKQPISVLANYICAGTNCLGTVNYVLQPPSGAPVTGIMPPALNFTPTQTGVYTLIMYGMCGGKECDKCVITFKTDCPPEDCCPEPIKITPGNPNYSANPAPASTIVSNNFSISGLGTKNIVEVRANVVSYTITDNFNKECMKCVNLPFTWASMASATNIGTASPMITMFGGATVPSFNGSGAGSYQNPREIVWNNGSNLNSPPLNNIGIKFILPLPPGIDCCELKGKICIKFTFRDKDCKECEAVACFDFVIKKK